jgi:hypothetical protein
MPPSLHVRWAFGALQNAGAPVDDMTSALLWFWYPDGNWSKDSVFLQ